MHHTNAINAKNHLDSNWPSINIRKSFIMSPISGNAIVATNCFNRKFSFWTMSTKSTWNTICLKKSVDNNLSKLKLDAKHAFGAQDSLNKNVTSDHFQLNVFNYNSNEKSANYEENSISENSNEITHESPIIANISQNSFKCELCSLSFVEELSLSVHVKIVHRNVESFRCDSFS